MTDLGFHDALKWLQAAVPGFSHAYMHDAQFQAVMENRLRLMLIEVELMTLGSESRLAGLAEKVRQMERGAGLTSIVNQNSRPLTREDLERGRDNPGPRDIA